MEGEQKLKKKEVQSYPVCFLLLSLAEHYDVPFKRLCTSIPVAFWNGDEAFEWAKEMAFPCFSTVTLTLPCWFLQCWQLSLLLKQRIPVITSTSTSRAGKVVEGGPDVRRQSSLNAGAEFLRWHESHCVDSHNTWNQAMKVSQWFPPLLPRSQIDMKWWKPLRCFSTKHETRASNSATAFFSSKWNQVTHSNECGMCLIYPRLRPEGKWFDWMIKLEHAHKGL